MISQLPKSRVGSCFIMFNLGESLTVEKGYKKRRDYRGKVPGMGFEPTLSTRPELCNR